MAQKATQKKKTKRVVQPGSAAATSTTATTADLKSFGELSHGSSLLSAGTPSIDSAAPDFAVLIHCKPHRSLYAVRPISCMSVSVCTVLFPLVKPISEAIYKVCTLQEAL